MSTQLEIASAALRIFPHGINVDSRTQTPFAPQYQTKLQVLENSAHSEL